MLHASNLTHNGITHGFFTRGEAFELAGVPVVTCKQVHGAVVHVITEAPASPMEGDGLVTKTKGVAIGVLTADCAPVLFADEAAGVVGAAHAGWRGALGGVIPATIHAMIGQGAKRERIVAAVGPCIAQESYEVGPEFFAKFMHEDHENAVFFKPSKTPDHQWFDLKGFVKRVLQKAGIRSIEVLPQNTYTEEAMFNSFRRSTHRGEKGYGNQLSSIMV